MAIIAFRNPANGYVETVTHPGLWTLLFGCFYFGAKGVWLHAVMAFALAVITGGLSWLIYPFFARRIIETHYLRHGWQRDDTGDILVEQRSAAREAKIDRSFSIVEITLMVGFALFAAFFLASGGAQLVLKALQAPH